MAEFIAKYWIEALFGLIIAVLSFSVKHYYKLWKNAQEVQKDKMLNQLKEELQAYFQEAIKEVRTSNAALLHAVLEVQKKQFKVDCQRLLETTNSITFEQFEDFHNEYDIYKSLGGNGSGTTLFELVREKYSAQMIQKDQVDLLAENFDLTRKQCPLDNLPPNATIRTSYPTPPSNMNKEARG